MGLRCEANGEASFAGLEELLGPAEQRLSAMPSGRQTSSTVTSPRRPSGTMRIIYSSDFAYFYADQMVIDLIAAIMAAG